MKTPKPRMLAAAIVLLLMPGLRAFAIPPVAPEGAFGGQVRVQLTADLGRWDPMLEAQGLFADPQEASWYRALTLGGYYRLHRNLKVGAFYRLQWGARHDDDWIATWEWWDSGSRLEQVLMLDVSPRFLLPFLPGKDWVFQLKSRYELNTWNLQQSLLLRPELTWFWIVDRRPVLNLSLAYGLYFPLNFGETLIYEHSPYLALLYHLSPSIQLELSGAYRTVIWSTSQASIGAGDPLYQIPFRAWVVGFGLLLRLGG